LSTFFIDCAAVAALFAVAADAFSKSFGVTPGKWSALLFLLDSTYFFNFTTEGKLGASNNLFRTRCSAFITACKLMFKPDSGD